MNHKGIVLKIRQAIMVGVKHFVTTVASVMKGVTVWGTGKVKIAQN
jgi:hypothetical protein